jgi:diguanylate cyclase (GGDEF)-like protein/PAS domain S-box-containing protein
VNTLSISSRQGASVATAFPAARAGASVGGFPGEAVSFFDQDLRLLVAGTAGLTEIAMLRSCTIFEVFPPEIADVLAPLYRLALAGQELSTELPFEGRVYSVRLGPLRDADGGIAAGIALTQDVTEVRQSERALRHSEEQFRLTFEHAPIGEAVAGLDGRYQLVNQAMCEITGYSQAQLLELTISGITHPDDRAKHAAAAARLVSGELTAYTAEKRFVTASGEIRVAAVSASLIRGEDGSPVNFITQVQDITERKQSEQVLAEERRRLRAAQSIGHIGSWEMDVATRAVTWSDTLFDLYGLDPGTFSGDYLANIHADDREGLHDAIEACALTGAPLANRHRVYRVNDGELRWLDARGARLQDGPVSRVAGSVIDVTEQVLAAASLEHAALHDPLTGLPNRRLVVDRLERALDRSEREGDVAVLFCDLDGFKRVNDVHGHHAGDGFLIEAAARIGAATRSGDTVGRMGGDEFVVICAVPRGEDAAELADLIAGRIGRAMSEPITVDGLEHRATVSTGICLAHQSDNADTVLRNADVAMYAAKARGKNGYAMFDATLRTDALDRDNMERKIRLALVEDTLEVHYHPIVEPGTGRVRALEALVRVPDGEGRYLDAFQAVSVAEQTGIVSALDERVLRLACAHVAAQRTQPGHSELAVTVNRSAAEVARPGFYDRITDAVAATDLDPHALTIEITETVLLDAGTQAIADLRRLRSDGIGIAIDDFGTGYASLRYLATLPINCLKVDRSFTAGLPHDPTCTTIVRATLGLAADLGMDCVVEGVETIEQLNALPDNAHLLVQGFLYARPQPASASLPTHLAPLTPTP